MVSAFVKELLKKCGSEILEVADDFGWMPLHYASQFGNAYVVQLFLKTNGSLAYIKSSSEGMTALHIATRNGKGGVVRKLIEERPDICELVDNKGRTALHVAVNGGQSEFVKILLDTTTFVDLINERDEEGNTSLHLAAIDEDYQCLKILANDERVDKRILNNKNMAAIDIIKKSEQLTPLEKVEKELTHQ